MSAAERTDPSDPRLPLIRGEVSSVPPTPPTPRPFKTAFSPEFLATYHAGTMNYEYRGVRCLKDPIDLALYLKLIYEERPGSIIEIGSFDGGSARLYADITKVYGLQTRIVTMDVAEIPQGSPSDPRITMIQADAERLAESAFEALLADLPRPLLVIEDSAHTCAVTRAVLDYFVTRMDSGEVLVIEDGVVEDQGVNAEFGGGPNRAIHEFFLENPGQFEIMTNYTDFYGVNATFNPNGYLRKL